MKAWFQRIRQWLAGSPRAESGEKEPSLDFGDESGAHPGGQPPRELHKGRRRLKENYTSHWDLDYLPREEVERLMNGGGDRRE